MKERLHGYRPLEGATLRVLGLGLGVQSYVMAEMFERGEIGPPPDFAFVADTRAERVGFYSLLREVTTGNRRLSFPVKVRSRGDLGADVLASAASWSDLGELRQNRANWPAALRVANPPFFTRGPRVKARRVMLEAMPLLGVEAEEIDLIEEFERGGEVFGFLGRKCTREYKIEVAEAAIREHLGIAKGARVPADVRVEHMLGITTDEAHRMGGSSPPWIELTHPLIQERMSRFDCYARCQRWGVPIPEESGCWFCPFRDDAQWLDMQRNEPETFELACRFDEAIRDGIRGTIHTLYLHRLRIPLREIDFSRAHGGWASGFRDECAGVCGV
jgi:hypothetical protein